MSAAPTIARSRPDECTSAAIETRDLHNRFGRNRVLNGVDLAIPSGSAAAILGPSGTGKSVMIKHVLGLLRPDQGDVLVAGKSLAAMTRAELFLLRRGIGVMFQDGALFSSMNVFDNVAFPLRQHTDLEDDRVHAIVEGHLAAVGLAATADRYPAQLSGGMKKRAGLARALVLEPQILLCDEPDSGLDPVRTALLGELLRARHEEVGGTMVVITHNLDLARITSDFIAMLWRGRVAWSGATEDAFASEDPFVRQFLAAETHGPLGMDA